MSIKVDSIKDSFQNSKEEVLKTKNILKEKLSEDVYKSLKNKVQKEVDKTINDAVKVARVRQDTIKKLDLYAERNEKDDPDLFQRMKIRIETLHPRGIASDIKKSTDFDSLAKSYTKFCNKLSGTSIAGEVALRYSLPDSLVQFLTYQCRVPFFHLENQLKSYTKSFESHIKDLEKLKNSKVGKGLTMLSSIAGSVAAGAAFSALTGSFLAARRARKESSKGIGSWVAKKYFGPKIRNKEEELLQSFNTFLQEYDNSLEDCRSNLELSILTLYGGLVQGLEEDLNEAGQTISEISWQEGYIETALKKKENDLFVEWAEQSEKMLKDLKKDEKWVQLADCGEVALQYTLEQSYRTRVTKEEGKTSYSVQFARYRARGILKLAEKAWSSGKHMEAASLYFKLFTGSPVSFDNADFCSAKAGWRLAVVATLPEAPDQLKAYALGFLPFVQQARVRQDAKDGRYGLPGEMVAEETLKIAHAIHLFSKEEGLFLDINRRVPSDLQEDPEHKPCWNSSIARFTNICKEYSVPQEYDKTSTFGTWLENQKKKEQVKRLMIYTLILILALTLAAIFFVFV